MEQAKLESEKFKTQPAIEHLSINPRGSQKKLFDKMYTTCFQYKAVVAF